MKKYNMKITPLAEQDLTNIGDYIALELKNPSAALNTIKGIQQIITNLQFIPERYHLEIHMLADDRAWLYSTLKIIEQQHYLILHFIKILTSNFAGFLLGN